MWDWVARPHPRPSAEQVQEMRDILADIADIEFDTRSEDVVVVWWLLPSGQHQPIIWPLPPDGRARA